MIRKLNGMTRDMFRLGKFDIVLIWCGSIVVGGGGLIDLNRGGFCLGL